MSEKNVILKVENVSKLYRLGTVGTGTFGGDVQRFWKTKILGQEDPFMKIGQTNDRTSKEKADFVWALQNINFEVKRGEVLGIIGKNGAGKSTLLKLLSRITSPTTGSIKSAGRMASLLEVGTGFHPELTGRENIYLNGAILGMTKKEIQSKFDEIVDFSGCELYIDTPTKRYSSGMTVRLGFAVAAFLDPEILVVDEVLAVGDAEFQKKAIGKMQDVSKGEGKTVLFVSHNMGSIDALCKRALVMKDGMLVFDGTQKEGISYYLQNEVANISKFREWKEIDAPGDERAKILKLEVTCPEGFKEINFSSGIVIKATIKSNISDQALDVSFNVKTEKEELLIHHGSLISNKKDLVNGIYNINIIIPPYLLNNGSYLVDVWLGLAGVEMVGKFQENVIGFSVTANEIDKIKKELPGILRPMIEYQIEKQI
jgi:lipopolysaccharide transport system ATP-binding protein